MIRSASLGAPGDSPLRILCLGAHCDDIEIGCGGTVLRLLAERPGVVGDTGWCARPPTRRASARRAPAPRRSLAGAAEEHSGRAEKFRDGYLPFQGAEIKEFFEELKPEIAAPT